MKKLTNLYLPQKNDTGYKCKKQQLMASSHLAILRIQSFAQHSEALKGVYLQNPILPQYPVLPQFPL